MGIPSYFSYIVKNHPSIIKKYNQSLIVNNLYLDCNSIIYDCYHKISSEALDIDESISLRIIRNVISKIEEYLTIINPKNTLIIAFDGVAPVAKLEQQRSRRYKSWYQNEVTRLIFKKTQPDPWNTTSITPGTKFMFNLNNLVSQHFNESFKISHNLENIIVSGSNQIGEGEHKLFEYIRSNNLKHAKETTIIYGLDADLIMLSINHLPICPNIYLFRETPHFIQSIDSSLEPDSNYILDIPELTHAIVSYMNCNQEFNIKKVYDYIFLCFFLGNDFLPHFPALNIRTGGVDKMMNSYKATIGQTNEFITDGKTINWNNLRKVVFHLASLEEEYFIKEHLLRNKKEKYYMPDSTPEEKFKNLKLLQIMIAKWKNLLIL